MLAGHDQFYPIPMTEGPVVELLVGKVGRAHGLGGDVIIDVRTDEPERRFSVDTQFATTRGPMTVTSSRWHGRQLLVTFAEVRDRSAAEAMRGVELRITVCTGERPADPEEFYDHQLVGLQAYSGDGEPLGGVVEVLHLPAQEVLVVRQVGRDVFVPFVTDLVPVVDVDAGRIVVNDLPGLFDDDQSAADGTGGA